MNYYFPVKCSDPFLRGVPQECDVELICDSQAMTCAFNRHGTLFAIGCSNGNILVWDYLTRSMAKRIHAFTSSIVSISWSNNGKYLVCVSSSCSIFVFNVLEGACEKKFQLPSLSMKVQFHPKLNNIFLACPTSHTAVVVDIQQAGFRIVPQVDKNESGIIGTFDSEGSHLYIGNSTGKIYVYSYVDFTLKASFNVTNTHQALRCISFSKCGGYYIVNATDRILRVYCCEEVLICGVNGEPEPLHKLQDIVSRADWTGCCFSGDGEYICAGSISKNEIFVWRRDMGNLVTVLRGRNGSILKDVDWHPTQPSIISLSGNNARLWKQIQIEKWSAFLPGFTELDENIGHDERESGFDIINENRTMLMEDEESDEFLEVDVVNASPKSSNADSEALLYLPAYPEQDDNDVDDDDDE